MQTQKRGQITIFIIVGIILLSLVAVFLYVRNINEQVIVPIDIVPQEFTPVADYIDSCIGLTLKEGVKLLGQQGGYVYIPKHIAVNPSIYIPVEGNIKIPYWYANGKNTIPTRENMESDLTYFVQKNLPLCIDSFRVFKDNFDIAELGNITPKVTVGRTEVIATLNYPIQITSLKEQASTKMSTFEGSVSVNIHKILTLAKEILDAENTQGYLEDTTINLMALTPPTPRNRAVPFSDMEFSCRQIKWNVQDVKSQIQRLLFYNLPRIKIANTDNTPFDDSDAYAKLNFLWQTTQENYKDLKADVYYDPSWNFFFSPRPSDGEYLRSSSGKGPTKYLKFLCLNIYHFTYDVVYPVQIVIQDEKAFANEGFIFRYAIPVQINHNQADRANFGVNVYDTPLSGTDYCAKTSDRQFTVTTKDALTMQDIRDINITFSCAGSFFCPLGKTTSTGQTYSLVTNLPDFCSPGSIEAEGQFAGVNYFRERKIIDPESNYLDIYMTPLQKLEFVVQKHRTNLFDTPEFMEEGENVFIYITSEGLEDFDIYRTYPAEKDGEKTIELLMKNTTYQLSLILTNKDDKFIGGYSGNWTVDSSMLSGKSKVIFKVAEFIPHPANLDEEALSLFKLNNVSASPRIAPVLS